MRRARYTAGTERYPSRTGTEETVDVTARPDPAAAEPSLPVPTAPFDVVVVGPGRVGGSYARALERAGHRVIARVGRDDDPSPIAHADVVVITVPDDALIEVAAMVARLGHAGAVVVHSCGLHGVAPLADHGPHIAAIHPAAPIASDDQSLEDVIFGVTGPGHLNQWCESFVADLGGRAVFIDEDARPAYHAALAMASNFPVALAGDAAEVLGNAEILVPLMRSMVENIARLGPDAALTGPIVRCDTGTIVKHLEALPTELLPAYIENALRTVERAVRAGRIDEDRAATLRTLLEEGRP